VRRAGREGVEIVEGDEANLDEFYEVLRITTELKGFPLHDKVFYQEAWRNFHKTNSVKLLLARYQGKTVAGKMIFVYRDRCMHLFGGTTLEGRDIYASYLIQWESIKYAISRGYKYTDLWGIPDEVGQMLKSGQELPKEGEGELWGVYLFKRGFGGEVESYVGTYDYPYWPKLYSVARKILESKSVDTLSHWLEVLSG